MNENIYHYCREFIESTENPQFAIFIKGEWGTGKTYFIKKLIKSFSDNKSAVKCSDIIYISLFGVSSQAEIDAKIFQAIHPVLSSGGMQLAGVIFRTALKIGANFDINNDGKSDGSISFGGLPSKKSKIKIKEMNKKLIIVDDFERALLDPCQIFGYFSEIINQSNCKVIFVGNEEQIANEGENIKDRFKKIKEKTIGLEFQIEPDINNALDCFLAEAPISKDFNKEIKEIILEVVAILECSNLRIIRQSIFNLRILINSIDGIIKNNEHKADIIRIFLVLFIQKSLGLLTEENIDNAIIAFIKYRLNIKRYLEKINSDNNYKFNGFYDRYIPLLNCWKSIIFEGLCDKKYLTTEYEKEIAINSREEPKNLFILLDSWKELNKEKFYEMIEKIDCEIDDGKYLHPGEILHYFNIMAIFSNWKLLPRTVDEVKRKVLDVIERHKKQIVLIDDWGELAMSYGGWAYSDEITEIAEIKKILKDISKENYDELIKIQIKEDIENMDKDVKEFCRGLIHINGNNKYYRKPFLKLVDIDFFYNKMCSLSLKDQELIIYSLEERYGKKYSNGELYQEYRDDLQNLINLTQKYKNSIGSIEYNPIEFIKKNIADSLESLVEYFHEKTRPLPE